MGEEKYEGQISGREFLPGGDDGGLNITGSWLNKRTGQTVNIRQSVQDGDQMIIITDKGQISMEVFSRDYIQASEEIYNENGQVIDKAPLQVNPDMNEIMNYENRTLSYDDHDIYKSKKSKPAQVSTNEQIIKKVFDKLTSFPEVSIDIKWEDFPTAQIETLVNFLDVKVEDISKYIVKKYCNTDSLGNLISQLLQEKLNKNILSNSNE